MRNLLLLIARFGSTILFVFLEVICFFLIINYNRSQKEIWAHSANLFTGSVNSKVQSTSDYFYLESVNDSLLTENAKLLAEIINYRIYSKNNEYQDFETQDSILQEYDFVPSRICGKTVNLRNNYITLCRGAKDSIQAGMGVISSDGIVGIVKNVSDNYAQVMTILHGQSQISSSIMSNDFHGTLVWEGEDARKMSLITLPKHAKIAYGDTIVTSGYSTVFPFGIQIGTISDFEIDGGGNSYKVDIDLFNDISNLSHVYVVKSKFVEEKEEIISEADQ